MYRLWNNLLSHGYYYNNPTLKQIAEKKYDYLYNLYKGKNFRYTFKYDNYTIVLVNNNGVGRASYFYEETETSKKEAHQELKSRVFGLLSLITVPLFVYDGLKITPIIHNNIIDLHECYGNSFKRKYPYSFNGNLSLSLQKEIASFEAGFFKPTGMFYFTYFNTPEKDFPDPITMDLPNYIRYKKRKIYNQYSVKTKCKSWSESHPARPPRCGGFSSSSGSSCIITLCNEFTIDTCNSKSETEGTVVYSYNDGGCAWRFGHSFSNSNSCNLYFIYEWSESLHSKCLTTDALAFWDTVSYEYVIPFLKTETLHQNSYIGESWNHEKKSKDETTYRIMLGNRLLKKGHYKHNYIGNDFFTDCEWSKAVCGHYGLTTTDFFGCLGGYAPSVYYSVSETRNKLVTEKKSINPYYWDIFLPKNIKRTNNPKYYAIIYTIEDNNSQSVANPKVRCMDCSKGYFPFLGSGLCCNDSGCFPDPEGNPDVPKYYVPTMEGFESSVWTNDVKSFSHTEYATYLNIDGEETEIARGTFAWCGKRWERYKKIIDGDYIYETYFKNIGVYIFMCMMLAYGVCDFIFRDTPFIEYYDLSNTFYKDRFEALLLYSYIVLKAKGCDESKDELKKCVIGYKLYDKEKGLSVHKEEYYHPLRGLPTVKTKVLEGDVGELKRNATDKFYFYIQASTPFYNSELVKVKVDSPKLNTPNGGIEFEVDWDYVYKYASSPDLITSYNVFVLNMDANGIIKDEHNPFKLIAVIPNEYKGDGSDKNKVKFRITRLYPDSFTDGIATNVYKGFMLGSFNWKPIRVLDTLSERVV